MNFSIRNDDVFQNTDFTADQERAFKIKSPYHWFLEADKPFAEHNFSCTLVVLSEGLDLYHEWVKYVKENIGRYKIELHGSSHLKYKKMTEEEGLKDLQFAKNRIEQEFGQKITTWYVPFGRSNIPEWGDRVCEKLGIKMDRPTMKQLPYFWDREPKREQINFHYWDLHQILQIRDIIETLCQKNTKLG